MKLVRIGYGHDGRGVGQGDTAKGYSYLVEDNTKTGTIMSVLATHHSSKKIFTTTGNVLDQEKTGYTDSQGNTHTVDKNTGNMIIADKNGNIITNKDGTIRTTFEAYSSKQLGVLVREKNGQFAIQKSTYSEINDKGVRTESVIGAREKETRGIVMAINAKNSGITADQVSQGKATQQAIETFGKYETIGGKQ